MNEKNTGEQPGIVDLLNEIKRIGDRVPVDFGGGSPLSKTLLMAYLALEFKLRTYVEIGIYRGKSLFPMAHATKLLGGMAYGIDAYDLETAKEYDAETSIGVDVNEFLAGVDFGQMYADVKNLQAELGFNDCSVIIKDDSKHAVKYFRENQIVIDMLHIDGNHDTPAVQADADAYIPLVRDGGLIVVDDINWESVMRVYRTLQADYREIFNDGYFAVLVKEAPGKPTLNVSPLHLDTVYALGKLTAQLDEKDAALNQAGETAAEQVGSLRAEIERLQSLLAESKRKASFQLSELMSRLSDRDNQIQSLNDQIQEIGNQSIAKDEHIRYLDSVIAGIYQSTSWKVSRPVRLFKDMVLKTREKIKSRGEAKTETGFRPRESTRDKKISVIVTAYNHEQYIAQCLDSILMQKGFFKLEMIIGDDCSTDATAAIISRYRKSHRGLIKVMPAAANMGVTKNLKRCLDACSGDYIAICEGDDYWLDEYKLQKQMEFLEDHPDWSMCFSRIMLRFENEAQLSLYEPDHPVTGETISTADLIVENCIGNFSCCMYRAQAVRALPKAIFDVYTVDWMFNMACGEQGPIGYLPEPLSVYRKHSQGAWSRMAEIERIGILISLMDAYNSLLGGKYAEQFNKQKRHLAGYKNRLVKLQDYQVSVDQGASGLHPAGGVTYHLDLLILDTIFPHPLSPFRFQEFISYLDHFPSSFVLTTGEHLPALKETRGISEIIDIFEQEYAAYAGSTITTNHQFEQYSANLAYVVFLSNLDLFLDGLEKKHIPFVFTLYPGGGFLLNHRESDKKLERFLKSPMFRKVIVTQKITYDYLIEKNLCPPEQIEFIYGVVTPLEILTDYNDKHHYGFQKDILDIAFVAHKYMKGGIDKGYGLFIDSARELAAQFKNIHFHVVGNFDQTDLPIDGLEGRLTFYGQRKQSWFDEFYRDIDIILSPNQPFILIPGAFDGFPTASCTEAGLRKVAIFCTDELDLNIKFTPGKDIVIIQPDTHEIVETIQYYLAHPAELKSIAECGHDRIRDVYSYENQIAPRIRILENELKARENNAG